MKRVILAALSALAFSSVLLSVSALSLPSVEASAAGSEAIEIASSSAGVDLQAMFDAKAKAAGCEGQALAWLRPRSPFRAGSEADLYPDFRFLQVVPCRGDLYFYYYSVRDYDSPAAFLSFAGSVGSDGLYHDSYSLSQIDGSPLDYGYFRKSVLRGAYAFSVGSSHRVSVAGYAVPGSPNVRECDHFELCWTDVADGSDPVARSFSDDYVVVSRKLCVLDCVLVPRTGGFPNSALENFWCFFDLGSSSSPISSLDSLRSVRVSYIHSSYVASEHRPMFCDGRNMNSGHVYGGLYRDDSDYLGYLGDSWREADSPFPRYPSKAVSDVSFDSLSVDSAPIVSDVVSSGVTVVKSPNEGDPVNQWLFGHDDLVYAFDSIQRLDDASLALLQAKESFLETDGRRVKPFVDLCREYRGYSDSEGSGSFDYAVLLNDRAYRRSVVSEGLCWGGYYTNTACDQIDSVRLLSLTFHNDVSGGDISFSCVDVPADTTVAHITQPYTVHVKGFVDYVSVFSVGVLTALKVLLGVAAFAGLAYVLSLVLRGPLALRSLVRGRRAERRLKKLESKGRR